MKVFKNSLIRSIYELILLLSVFYPLYPCKLFLCLLFPNPQSPLLNHGTIFQHRVFFHYGNPVHDDIAGS